MFRREHHVGRAIKCVRARREHADLLAVDLEINFSAFTAADPILLE